MALHPGSHGLARRPSRRRRRRPPAGNRKAPISSTQMMSRTQMRSSIALPARRRRT